MAEKNRVMQVELLATLDPHKRPDGLLSFSDDGRMLASTHCGQTYFWQEQQDGCWQWQRTTDGLLLQIHPDHSTLLLQVEGEQGAWKLRAVDHQDPHGTLLSTRSCRHMHQRFVYGYTPDARWFLTYDHDGWLSIWEPDTFRFVRRCRLLPEQAQTHFVIGGQCTPDGKHWVFFSDAWIWHGRFDTEQPAFFAEGMLFHYGRRFESYQLSPKGNLLAVINDTPYNVEVYEYPSMHLRSTFFDCVNPRLLAFSRDEAYLACADHQSQISIWELETGQLVHAFCSHAGPYDAGCDAVEGMDWSPRGDILAVAGLLPATEDYSIKVWKLTDGS